MKDYIKDKGRVRICDSNVAKMNIFEWMYYKRFELIMEINYTLDQLKEGFILVSCGIINSLCVLLYPIVALYAIHLAKKVVKRNEN